MILSLVVNIEPIKYCHRCPPGESLATYGIYSERHVVGGYEFLMGSCNACHDETKDRLGRFHHSGGYDDIYDFWNYMIGRNHKLREVNQPDKLFVYRIRCDICLNEKIIQQGTTCDHCTREIHMANVKPKPPTGGEVLISGGTTTGTADSGKILISSGSGATYAAPQISPEFNMMIEKLRHLESLIGKTNDMTHSHERDKERSEERISSLMKQIVEMQSQPRDDSFQNMLVTMLPMLTSLQQQHQGLSDEEKATIQSMIEGHHLNALKPLAPEVFRLQEELRSMKQMNDYGYNPLQAEIHSMRADVMKMKADSEKLADSVRELEAATHILRTVGQGVREVPVMSMDELTQALNNLGYNSVDKPAKIIQPTKAPEISTQGKKRMDLKDEFADSLIHLGAKTITDAMTDPVAAGIALHLKKSKSTSSMTEEQIKDFLEGDIGKGMVAGIVSGLMTMFNVPGLSKEHSEALAKAMRKHAMYLGGGVVVDSIMQPLFKIVGEVMATQMMGVGELASGTANKVISAGFDLKKQVYADHEAVEAVVVNGKSPTS